MRNHAFKLPLRPASALAGTLYELIKGNSLSSNDALLLLGTSRLADAIHSLRHKYRFRIITDMVSVPTSDGRIANIAVYRLDPCHAGLIEIKRILIWMEWVKEARQKQRDNKRGRV